MLYRVEGIYLFTASQPLWQRDENVRITQEKSKIRRRNNGRVAELTDKNNKYISFGMTKIRFISSNIMCVVMCDVIAYVHLYSVKSEIVDTSIGANYVSLLPKKI